MHCRTALSSLESFTQLDREALGTKFAARDCTSESFSTVPGQTVLGKMVSKNDFKCTSRARAFAGSGQSTGLSLEQECLKRWRTLPQSFCLSLNLSRDYFNYGKAKQASDSKDRRPGHDIIILENRRGSSHALVARVAFGEIAPAKVICVI